MLMCSPSTGGGGGREVVDLESDAGSDGPRYAGTEIGDSHVFK